MNLLFTLVFTITLFSTFSACTGEHAKEKKIAPAKVDAGEAGALPTVVLTPEAENRIGVSVLKAETSGVSAKIATSAIIYDLNGKTWVYVRKNNQSYIRVHVELKQISEKTAWVQSDALANADVVVRGAAELYGTEHGVGK